MGVNFGLIGCGTMGTALLQGIISRRKALPENTFVYDKIPASLKRALDQFGVIPAASAKEAAEKAAVVILAVKPQDINDVLQDVSKAVKKDTIVISIAAGITTSYLENKLAGKGKVIRVMPNTPCLVGEGMMAVSAGSTAGSRELNLAADLFSSLGKVICLEEKYLDAVTGLSGSGPAYTYFIIDALADGGVEMGLSRTDANILAAQTVLGAAKMVLASSESPAILKNKVTSPGGTTSAGLMQLEKGAVHYWLIEAVKQAAERSKDLGKIE